jgi:uncharacterized protein with PIN domain
MYNAELSVSEGRTVSIQFYAELNDFIPRERRGTAFEVYLNGPTSVKDLIESQGVPHTEIGSILINNHPVDFSSLVNDGDSVSVYAETDKVDPTKPGLLRSKPLPQIKFVLDTHLGKLAKYLRMLGFDTLYSNDYEDEQLAQIASEQQRIVLSRDRGLLKRKIIEYGHYVRHTQPLEQLSEIMQWLDIHKYMNPFSRCTTCNGLLHNVNKKDIESQLEPKTKQYYNAFKQCAECKQIYWKGTHYQRLEQIVQSITDETGADNG